MKWGVVYAEEGVYAGWPANHGAWQWGDEFLVGFLRGQYSRDGAMHNIKEPYEKVQARSLDGGRTWVVEKPNVDFECELVGTREYLPPLSPLGTIYRVCGVYDTGGEYCRPHGGFYSSEDRGKTWSGPWAFEGMLFGEDEINTSRTCILYDRWFLSKGHRDIWGCDFTQCYQFDDGRFIELGTVCEDKARAVMPAVALVDGLLVAVLRRRKTGVRSGWVDSFGSDDGGMNWRPMSRVGDTGSHNGNPPALLCLPDNRLLCAFGNRDEGSIVFVVSKDRGGHWEDVGHRRVNAASVDIGYPRLFLRSDGTAVCVYYWTDLKTPHQHIAYTELTL